MGKLAESIKRLRVGIKNMKDSSPDCRKNAGRTERKEFDNVIKLIIDDNYKWDAEDTKEWDDWNS